MLRRQRNSFGTRYLPDGSWSQPRPATLMNRQSPTQIRNSKSAHPITPIGGAQKGIKPLLVGTGLQASIAGKPAIGNASKTKHAYFANIGCAHG